jgi:YebC/PmpR family DNA-binding regulatory protein
MSGHSKWASIKHKKGALDAKRGKLFSRLVKEITVAARLGGGDSETNPRLRTVVQSARDVNMPADNIDRAIKKGTGELPGVSYEECTYEIFAPGGVAIMVRALTDNRNRTTAELRNILSKKGGRLAGAGAVARIFENRGFITVAKETTSEDALLALALDAGADDFQVSDETFEIYTAPGALEAVKAHLIKSGIAPLSAEITMIPQTEVKVAGDEARQVVELVTVLEEHDDVQNVYSNFDVPDDILEGIQSEG